MRLISTVARLARKRARFREKFQVDRDLQRWRERAADLVSTSSVAVDIFGLGLTASSLQAVQQELKRSRRVPLASIDQDGFLLSRFGPIDGLPCVEPSHFVPRKKYAMDVVALDRIVGISKTFGDKKRHFLNEIEALYVLHRAGCNVPAILDIDFDSLVLTTSLVHGTVLREALAQKGAKLRDRQLDGDPAFGAMSRLERRHLKIAEGTKHLADCISTGFIEALYQQILIIHASGFLINDLKYGNIIIERHSGQPFLIDFERSERLTSMPSILVKSLLDEDIRRFNLLFGSCKAPDFAA